MDFGPHFRDFRACLKGSRPYAREITSAFKDCGDFTSDFKVFKPDYRGFCSDFTDYRDFMDFRSDSRTFVYRVSEVFGPSKRPIIPLNASGTWSVSENSVLHSNFLR